MKEIRFKVLRVVNGYLVATFETSDDVGEITHIAATQDEVAKVVKKICHGAFTEGDPKERPSGDKK